MNRALLINNGIYLTAVALFGATLGTLVVALDPERDIPWWTFAVGAVALVAEILAGIQALKRIKELKSA